MTAVAIVVGWGLAVLFAALWWIDHNYARTCNDGWGNALDGWREANQAASDYLDHWITNRDLIDELQRVMGERDDLLAERGQAHRGSDAT